VSLTSGQCRNECESKFRVVLVDDDEVLRTIWGEVLQHSADFEVVGHAADGLAALAMCKERLPDAVVTDWSMPALDGVELARRLRQEHPQMAVVLCSSRPPSDVPPDLCELGVAYLNKAHSAHLPGLLARLLADPGGPLTVCE
jgi:DNA-binding NarL/FixJ family response regulator